jgi:L-fuconolactonase
MRIDAHQHFWQYNPARDTWITDEMAVLKKDFLPDQLLPELAANNITGCIAVQADQSERETRFLLDLAHQYEAVQGVVGWVDLCAGNVAERVQEFAKDPKLCGFRHILQAEGNEFMFRPEFLRGIECLNGDKTGITYDILVYSRQLPSAIELVAKLPGQPFVLDHIGKPPIKEGGNHLWARDLRMLAENKNVYCKLSGLVTEADWQRWRASDFKSYLDLVLEVFGIDRVMFGSDWPVCLLAARYEQVVQLIADYAQSFSTFDQQKLFGLNAAKFYGQRASRLALATGE